MALTFTLGIGAVGIHFIFLLYYCLGIDENANNEDENANDEVFDRPFTHWLFKSEPLSRFEKGIDVKFGFDDLKSEPNQTACWDGVRNYQARNYMKDDMRVGDRAFFYHR